MNRERWDELVFNAYDNPTDGFESAQTIVLDRATVLTIRICIQSPDTRCTARRSNVRVYPLPSVSVRTSAVAAWKSPSIIRLSGGTAAGWLW